MFQKENTLPFMTLNRASEVPVAGWLRISNMLEKLLSFFTCSDTVFLSAGNPYKALQFL